VWGGAFASAATRSVPPGVSGATQYTETLPGPAGEESTRQIGAEGRHPGASAKDKLGEENAGRLEELGPEGKAAANLAAAGVTGSGGGPGAGRGGGAGNDAVGNGTRVGEPSGSSPVGQLLGDVTGTSGSEGMGLLLPLLIAASALIAVGYLVGWRRTIRAHD
jgi:hypothetical protein